MKGTMTNGDASFPVHDVEFRANGYWVGTIGNENWLRTFSLSDGWSFEEETPRTMDVIKALEAGTVFTVKYKGGDRDYIRLFGNKVYDDKGYEWYINEDFGPDMKEKVVVK